MRVRFCVALLVLGCLVLGCSDDKTVVTPEPDPYMKQTSITNCLFNLKLAYNQRNVAKYSNLFDDDYLFVFDPIDVVTHGFPESWGRSDEIISATNLLDSLQNSDGYVCEHISLNFLAGAETPSQADSTWTEVTLSQVVLMADSRHQSNADPLRYEVIGDQAKLSFVQTAETDPSSGLKIWKIIQWIDKPIGAKTAVETTTWGQIKANWRREAPDPDPYMRQTSIANCLFNLKLSYNQRNEAKFNDLLDATYQYIFDPRDVGTHGIPESWGRADEIVSATNIFTAQANADGYVCEHISLNFQSGSDVVSEVEPGWRKVTLTQITLLVDARHRDNGDPLRYEVIGDQADIHFIQTDAIDQPSGLRIWKIIYWVDKPIGAKTATEHTTWGRIKANWR
jgi:hypothetical protein